MGLEGGSRRTTGRTAGRPGRSGVDHVERSGQYLVANGRHHGATAGNATNHWPLSPLPPEGFLSLAKQPEMAEPNPGARSRAHSMVA